MKKARGQFMSGLDVGSYSIRFAVAQKTEAGIKLIGAAEAPSVGVHHGIVNSIEECVSSISSALERAERMVGAPIEHVWVAMSGAHVSAQESKGVVAVARSDGEISREDVERALEAARTVATPLNHEILHVMPQGFSVDGQTGIKDPVGMTGVRLEVDTKIVQGLTQHIKNLTKAVYRTGLDIDNIVLSSLATAEAVLTPRQKELGVAVIDVGSSTISMAVYEEGDLIHIVTLPLGSERITSDIAIGLRIDIDLAEKIKLACGRALAQAVPKKEEIDVAELGAPTRALISCRYVAEIIEARVEEMFKHVDKELKKIGKSGMLPCGVVLTGGGSKLPELTEAAKKFLKLPSALGCAIDVESITDKVNDLSFATSIGLALWGKTIEEEHRGRGMRGFVSRFQSVDK